MLFILQVEGNLSSIRDQRTKKQGYKAIVVKQGKSPIPADILGNDLVYATKTELGIKISVVYLQV